MKIVLMPIRVPSGKHCWEYHNGEVCQYFDNSGGHDTCDLGFSLGKRDENGSLKSENCAKLIEKGGK